MRLSLVLIAILLMISGNARAESAIDPDSEFAAKNPEIVDIFEADEKQAMFLLKAGSVVEIADQVAQRFCRDMGSKITETKNHGGQGATIPQIKGMIEVEKSYVCDKKFLGIFARMTSEMIYGPVFIVIGQVPLMEEVE